ncbi:MAG: excisionase family DNA-binding protein [Treponema sp.]|jgi:excisionase family DNA binding protein|nr:excisionase family DNA-binding protein [Treponema sp.]
MSNQFYTVRQTADVLNISYQTVFRKITDKEFPSIRMGRKILVPASFLKELEEKAIASTKADA